MTPLRLHHGNLTFTLLDTEEVAVPLDCLQRSKLLQDILESTDDMAEAEVPVTPAALQLWLRHSQLETIASADKTMHDQRLSYGAPSDKSQPPEMKSGGETPDGARSGLSIQEVSQLMTAADMLIDEHTKAACARTISAMMLHCSPHRLPPIIEAVSELPEHLQLAILALTPLPHCLSHVPPSWHPLALRAHHPSIDTHATLALHRLPIASVHSALSAAATLTTLRALSLAGLTLPLDCAPCISLLAHPSSLTSLNLHDIGLRQPSADALAAVLPTLRQLQSLDLSSNYIYAPLMRFLAPALRRCTGLRSLNLWNALGHMLDDGDELANMACAIRAMPHLTALALGRYEDSMCKRSYTEEDDPSAAGCSAFITSLLQLRELLDLQLKLFYADCDLEYAPEVFNAVATLTQLQRLHYVFSQVEVPPIASGSHPVHFAARHSQLTSVELDYLSGTDDEHVANAGGSASAILRDLAQLPQLQRLWLRVPTRHSHQLAWEPCTTLAKVLPRMTRLSHVHLLAAPVDAHNSVDVQPGSASVAAVIKAALCMPQLQLLHVPVTDGKPVAGGDALPTAVSALVKAASETALQVSVDLYVRLGEIEEIVEPPPLAYVPLFPYAKSLDMWCDVEDHLQQLVDNLHELRRLRELRINVEVNRIHGGPFAALLDRVSCFSSLEQLHCICGEGEPHSMQDCELTSFLTGLRGLTDLTYLKFDFEQCSMQFQEGFLRACASLPRLRVLDLRACSGLGEAWCSDVLTGFRLKELHVRHPFRLSAGLNRDGVLNNVKHLEHLRSMTLGTCDDSAAVLATAHMPAFQVLW